MTDSNFHPTRRIILLGTGIMGLSSLASCISVLPTGERDGASASAEQHVSALRQANGVPGLAANAKLEQAAIQQAGYMEASGKMDHTALRGRDFFTRMKKNGIAAPAAENLAHGRMDIARALQMWMDSPPHRRNMLDERFGQFGLGYAVASDDRRYWAMILAA